jgi:hypothetical protein
MRETTIACACAALFAIGCGSSGGSKKTDGGLGGAVGTGGQGVGGVMGTGGFVGAGGGSGLGGIPGTNGFVGTGGGPGAGDVPGTGGATGVDAGPAQDTGIDGTATRPEADGDRGSADTRDVAIEPVAIDGATSLDVGAVDSTIDQPSSEAATPACVAAGGTCSPARYEICPAHYEPIDQGTGHLDCPNNGWCCAPAPPSPCSDQDVGNCVVGDTCTGCWAPAPSTPACESGRICCVDNCW